MNTRLIISLFFAGALAFACGGPRPHTDLASGYAESRDHSLLNMMVSARSRAASGARSSESARATNAAADAPSLDAHLDVKPAPNAVRFTLAVTNLGAKKVELTFPSGKAYDFVVLDSLGRDVWHWSTGRLFTQAVQNKLLARGESMRVEEEWKSPAGAKAGRYTAVAVVNSTNYPLQQRVEFTLP